MLDLAAPLEAAIDGVTRLRTALHKGSNRQVRNTDERRLVKATAHAWFKNHRPLLTSLGANPLLREIDESFTSLLEAAEQSIAREKYRTDLQTLKSRLIKLRTSGILSIPSDVHQSPNFAALISDPKMLEILERRWDETQKCKKVGAHLAATVMLGGLLEALFLARINRITNPAPVFTAKTAPRDKSGKTRALKEWGLNDYLNVANELKWIRQSAKDVGAVLRDYRNYIHPEKELSRGITVGPDDTQMFVSVFSSIADQIIESAKR